MHWVGLHPYRAAFVAIFMLVALGGTLVYSKSAQAPVAGDGNTWGQLGSLTQQPGTTGTRQTDTVGKQISDNDIYASLTAGKQGKYGNMISNDIPTLQTNIITNVATSYQAGEVEAFLASVKPSAEGITTKNASGEDLQLSDVYSYIPSNSIPTAPAAVKNRTPFQEALYNYGNDAGSVVEDHNTRYPNVASIMDPFFKDRTDNSNIEKVKGLALSLARAGKELATVEPIPESARSLNTQLSASYGDISDKLLALIQAPNDSEMVKAINTYNASAESFAKAYTGLATLFSAAGVHFSSDESGRMFQFTPMQ